MPCPSTPLLYLLYPSPSAPPSPSHHSHPPAHPQRRRNRPHGLSQLPPGESRASHLHTPMHCVSVACRGPWSILTLLSLSTIGSLALQQTANPESRMHSIMSLAVAREDVFVFVSHLCRAALQPLLANRQQRIGPTASLSLLTVALMSFLSYRKHSAQLRLSNVAVARNIEPISNGISHKT
jgi:hypothetical protein